MLLDDFYLFVVIIRCTLFFFVILAESQVFKIAKRSCQKDLSFGSTSPASCKIHWTKSLGQLFSRSKSRVLRARQVRLADKGIHTILRDTERNNFASGSFPKFRPPGGQSCLPCSMQHGPQTGHRWRWKSSLTNLKKSAPLTLKQLGGLEQLDN